MRRYIPITIEEDYYIEATAVVDVYPGEPEVRYYPDGSGHPGSPPFAELVEVYIDKATDWDDNPVEVDDYVAKYLSEHPYLWEEPAYESVD